MTSRLYPTWDTPLSEAAPLDLEWAQLKLAIGWSPFRIARYYLDDAGEFSADLFDWLCAQDCTHDDIAHFARWEGVETKSFCLSIQHITPSAPARLQLLQNFISGEPLRRLPAAGAPAHEVAAYFDDVLDGTDWEHMSDEDERSKHRRLCEKYDWYLPQVSRALRQRRIVTIEKYSNGGQVEFTESGIPVYLDRFPQPQPLCPFKRRYFSLGHFTDLTGEGPCGSPSCSKCGREIADALFRR